jgi:hypothetical protein
MNTTEYPSRHIPGFRPLVPGEAWHRTDFTPDMLPEGWRPLLLGEKEQSGDLLADCMAPCSCDTALPARKLDFQRITRRPLPPPPPTFEHDGKTWNSHVPGDPCPVHYTKTVEVISADYEQEYGFSDEFHWPAVIGYRIPDEPQDDTAKMRERIAELEQQLAAWETEIGAVMPTDFKDWHQNAKSEHPIVARSVIESLSKRESQAWDHLATALTPRPIAEAGPVKDGVVRLFSGKVNAWVWSDFCQPDDTHFIDIRLPQPNPRAEYERAVAEAGGAFEAWLKAKGGAK